MTDATEALILDLVEWMVRSPRPYPEVMAAWRTSCPRLPVWEDAVERGLVSCAARDDGGLWVSATALGREALARAGRTVASSGFSVGTCTEVTCPSRFGRRGRARLGR
jgi:hypothetical protein